MNYSWDYYINNTLAVKYCARRKQCFFILAFKVCSRIVASGSDMEDAYQKYKEARHEAYVARSNSLNDFAFKTSERYDQWVLTLSGGALGISLTFLEKIAPDPAGNTIFLLGLSWLAFIVAVVAGFSAIFFSRQAIYRQLEIDTAIYGQFKNSTTENKMEGEILPEEENQHIRTLNVLNWTSLSSLTFGILLMCIFALANIAVGNSKGELNQQPQINVNVNLPQFSTNNTTNIKKVKP
jgi:hypothetical protein